MSDFNSVKPIGSDLNSIVKNLEYRKIHKLLDLHVLGVFDNYWGFVALEQVYVLTNSSFIQLKNFDFEHKLCFSDIHFSSLDSNFDSKFIKF